MPLPYNSLSMRSFRATCRLLALLPLAVALSDCASTSNQKVLYQQGRNVVRLESDSRASASERVSQSPAAMTPKEVAAVLNGVIIRPSGGLMSAVLNRGGDEPVFNNEDLDLLAPIVASGLNQATSADRINFTFWSPTKGRRQAPISGFLSAHDSYLEFSLTQHPAVGWQDPENPPSPNAFSLDYTREDLLLLGTQEERNGSFKKPPTLRIDYRRVLAGRQTPVQPVPASMGHSEPVPSVAPAVSPAAASQASTPESLESLQRQIRELTELNRQSQVRASQAQAERDAAKEDLSRLRQELAEMKQLLADKVLELNRLKNKSSGNK